MSNNLFSTTLRIFSVAGAAVFLSFSPAQAILIDNGSMTLDTGTGLEWLDLTESINRSFDNVSGQFGAGGDFAGWRHANFAIVSTLFVNAGFPDGCDVSPASPDMFQAIQLFGQTLSNQSGDVVQVGTFGSFDDTETGADPALQGVAGLLLTVNYVSPAPDFETADVFPDNFVAFIAAEACGHWLVRNAVVSVPAPGITILFGAGAFFLLRRRLAV